MKHQVNILEIKGYRAIQTEKPLILVKLSFIPSFLHIQPENPAVLHVTLIKIVILSSQPGCSYHKPLTLSHRPLQ